MVKATCYICKQKVPVKPSRKCCLCGRVTCPRCMTNRLYKRKVYYLCNHCKDKYDPETIEEKRVA